MQSIKDESNQSLPPVEEHEMKTETGSKFREDFRDLSLGVEFFRKFSQVYLNFCKINGIIDEDFGEIDEAEEDEDGEEHQEIEHGQNTIEKGQEGKKILQPQKRILTAKRNLVAALRETASVKDLHLFLNYNLETKTDKKFDILRSKVASALA